MKLSELTAISPIEGRYIKIVSSLKTIFSEYGLFKFRIQVEVRWLQLLSSCSEIKEVPVFDEKLNSYLDNIIYNFSLKDAKKIKQIEHSTNHDLKAVEYFLKYKIGLNPQLKKVIEFVHFACTSEDINNLAHALMLITARKEIVLPIWKKIIDIVKNLAKDNRAIPLLSRTHGQPATPSTLGKEMANFAYRLMRQYSQLSKINILGKFNGSVGNYNAHMIAYPKVNWIKLSKKFVNSLGIDWNPYTTQIEPHDYISELFGCITRFNTILIDFNRDIWGYISLNYFIQRPISEEIGSSSMPHKINPIDFEKSEGNLEIANTVMNLLINKLPISRWQRDLTDSTILRNLGVGIAHSLIAYQSTLFGIHKLEVNVNNLFKDLNKHWEILAEPIQTVMRRYGIDNPYEKLKKFTRGKIIDISSINNFIDSLSLPESEKIRLKKITPSNYVGYAVDMVDQLNIILNEFADK